MSKSQIIKDVIQWNNKYPHDYVWRKKHKIPFGSKEHLEVSHVDMVFDLIEERYMRVYTNPDDESVTDIVGNMTQEEIDKEFEDLDITQFNA